MPDAMLLPCNAQTEVVAQLAARTARLTCGCHSGGDGGRLLKRPSISGRRPASRPRRRLRLLLQLLPGRSRTAWLPPQAGRPRRRLRLLLQLLPGRSRTAWLSPQAGRPRRRLRLLLQLLPGRSRTAWLARSHSSSSGGGGGSSSGSRCERCPNRLPDAVPS